MNSNLVRLLLAFVALAALALASAGYSSSAGQGGSRNGNLQITQFNHVVINGSDISKLPNGENLLVREGQSASPTTLNWYLRNSNSAGSPLIKTGTGTLILPNSNTYGVTKVGPGTLANTPNSGSSMKQGQGRLVLTSTTGMVYEFRNLGPADLARVFLPDATTSLSMNFNKIVFATGSGPQDSGKRLLFGAAQAISQLEGWKVSSKPPVSKFTCSGGSCVCNGTADCLSLASSCTSDMSCAGSSSDIRCSCKN